MKLKTKFTLGIVSLITLSVVSVGGFTIYSQQKRLRSEMTGRYQHLANQLAKISEESLYQSDLVFFNFEQELRNERGYRAAAFVDNTNQIQIHSDPTQRNNPLTKANSDSILNFSAPVVYSGEVVGTAHLQISKNEIQKFFLTSFLEDLKRIGIITLIVLLVAVFLALLFAKTMLDPIERMIEGTRKISKGHREPIPFPKRHDELGEMGEELNQTIQKLKEVEEMKRDFVSGITHDLKSPLKGIQGVFSYLLKGRGKIPAQRLNEYLISGQNNASRLMKLIDDLLMTARIEENRVDLEPKLFDLHTTLKGVHDMYRIPFEEKKIKLNLELGADPLYVFADPEKTFYVLANLVSNALKYTDKGHVSIKPDENQNNVCVSVIDSGTGIPKEEQPLVFEKFHRSSHNKNSAKGTGLGLYIAKGFVEAQDGTISLQENPSGGSIFSFTLKKE